MAKSSINIQPIKYGSEIHNNREKNLDYVRPELSYLNEHFNFKSVESAKKEIEDLYVQKVGQKMQAKSEPIREAVLLVEDHHTIEDLKALANEIEIRFGIYAFQGYIHKDEGHKDEFGKWNSNLHAHLIFDWQDKNTGKSIKLNRQDMAELQTLVSEGLKMERGISSDKKHLNATAFKIGAEKDKLNRLHNIGEDLSLLDEYKRNSKADLKDAAEKKESIYQGRNEIYLEVNELRNELENLTTHMDKILEQKKQEAIEKIRADLAEFKRNELEKIKQEIEVEKQQIKQKYRPHFNH
jgi:hypothetical protein